MSSKPKISSVGIVGFGAFGQLIAAHLHHHFPLVINDRAPPTVSEHWRHLVTVGSSADVGRCNVIILAVPVSELATAIRRLRPHLRRGCIVVDVGSVKVNPAKMMEEQLPPFVDIVGTHPLFGPQSARNGIAGRKIAVCPVRGNAAPRNGGKDEVQELRSHDDEHDHRRRAHRALEHRAQHIPRQRALPGRKD